MQRAGILILSLTVSFLMLATGHAQDASDQFLKAWQDFQTAEKMERDARLADALDKYRSAGRILEQISADNPSWQPLVIEYRLKKTRENITRLEPQVANLATSRENPEGPLPVADRSPAGIPEISTNPYPTTTPRKTQQNLTSRSLESGNYSGGGSTLRELQRKVEELNNKLAERTAQLQSARVEIDKRKVEIVELRSTLNQATDVADNAKQDETVVGAQRKALEVQLNQARTALADAQADNEVLLDENADLFGKLEKASVYIQSSDAIRKDLLTQREELVEARDKAVKRTSKIKENGEELEKITTENRDLKKKVAALEKTSVPREELEKLAEKNKDLTDKLAEAERTSVSKKEYEKLLAEKNSLDIKYAEAEKRLEDTTAANPEKEKMVVSLQSELNTVNDRLLEAQSQLTRGQDQIKDLQRQLDDTSGELARMKINGGAKEQQNLAAENELLRGIIFRQIKEQTQRDDAKKALEQEIAKLQIKSEIINKQLATLAAPVLQLSPEERALFKQPIALLSEPNANSMEVALAVVKPADGQTPAAPPANAVPDNVREQIEKAKKLFYEDKNYLEAEKIYQQIVEEVPDNYVVLSNLGAVQIEAGKMSAAEVALKKAIEINPTDASAFTYLGVAYSRQGKFDEAISNLRQSLTIDDSNAVAHNYLGVCLGQKGDADQAEKEFKRATELNPDYPDAHFNLAVLYVNLQPPSIDQAKLHYDKATKLGAVPDPSLERLIQ